MQSDAKRQPRNVQDNQSLANNRDLPTFRTSGNMIKMCALSNVDAPMGDIVQYRRAFASAEVIEKLVKLGYLKTSQRHERRAIEKAISRLQDDVLGGLTISASDAPKSA
jgi:hypothetical protein